MRSLRARLLVALAVVVGIVGITGPNLRVPSATAQAGLFSDAIRQPAGDTVPPPDRTVVRRRYVAVNLSLMDGTPRSVGVPLGRGDVLTLNLYNYESPLAPQVTVTAVRDRVVPSSTGRGYVWSGHLQGSNPSADPITIAVEDGVMIANVHANGSNYQVRYNPAGVQMIDEIDERQIPPDTHAYLTAAQARQIALADRANRTAAAAASGAARAAAASTSADTGTTIDILVAYTTQARVEAGGTLAIVATINSAVAEANTAYSNSQVPQTMRLVGTMETTYTSAGLTTQNGLVTDLTNVTAVDTQGRSIPNAPMADVRAMRDSLQADLVSLWVEGTLPPNTAGNIGIAWVINSSFANNLQQFAFLGYSVVARAYATGPAYTFAHETGHNLGANHDRATDASIANPLYPYAFDFIAPGNAFHTVMAYPDKCNFCPAILNYSNPNVTYNGVATGVAGSGATAADNHQTLINTISAVVNFRQCNQQPCNGAGPTPAPSPTTPPAASPTPARTALPSATATPTASCSPRPAVTVNAVNAGSGVLQVTIAAGGSAATGPRLQQLQLGAATNALIDVPAAGLTGLTSGRSVVLPVETRTLVLTVRHATAGQATTVPLTVVDGCGSWPTLVGGGPNAF
ncbi:MAG TPA: M12 family metallo-peptidase [Chloroflexota bacterium]|nr:M12 family metallo-peptidase [Chloroflexota bacterium]